MKKVAVIALMILAILIFIVILNSMHYQNVGGALIITIFIIGTIVTVILNNR